MVARATTVLLLLVSALSDAASTSTSTSPYPPFGSGLRPYFYMPLNSTQWNSGAYGVTPRPVLEAQQAYQATMEADIDPWMNGPTGYRGCILAVRAKLAALLGVSVNDTVLVDNATEGINAILRNFQPPLGPDDFILDLSTAYGPFTGLYEWLQERLGVQTITAPILWPLTGPESFLAPVAALLAANASSLNIRVAVISHISAYPSAVLPVRELVDLLHAHKIPVIVDGAHALGNIPVNIPALGDPEVWFGNAHKWLLAPKSAALLYVRRDLQLPHVPAPMLVDSPESQDFPDRFVWTGTRDRSAYCAIQDALTFREQLGGEGAVMDYTMKLSADGGAFLAANWSSRLLHPASMASSMVSIEVPTDNTTACAIVAGQLRSLHGFYMPASAAVDAAHAPPSGIACYWRLSAQIFLEMADYERLAVLTTQLLAQLGALRGAVGGEGRG
jgi:isopenicillin-N epimerase